MFGRTNTLAYLILSTSLLTAFVVGSAKAESPAEDTDAGVIHLSDFSETELIQDDTVAAASCSSCNNGQCSSACGCGDEACGSGMCSCHSSFGASGDCYGGECFGNDCYGNDCFGGCDDCGCGKKLSKCGLIRKLQLKHLNNCGWCASQGECYHARNCRSSKCLAAYLRCKFGYFLPTGCCGAGCPAVGSYGAVYAVNPDHFDARDGRVYAAQGYGTPVAVPLAPTVRYSYNYGWGYPSSRLTPVSTVAPVAP